MFCTRHRPCSAAELLLTCAPSTPALQVSVDLPKKHGRGGQSALRFARLRMEKRHNYVRKVAELAVQVRRQIGCPLHGLFTAVCIAAGCCVASARSWQLRGQLRPLSGSVPVQL